MLKTLKGSIFFLQNRCNPNFRSTLPECNADQKYKNEKMLTPDILKSLAPTGTVRAGVYTGNFLLITGKTPEGDPDGVSPDLCRAIAQKLGVPLQLIPFKSQDALVDAVGNNECDIGFVGADPDRAAKVTFTPAYVEIQATYIVPEASTIKHASEVDRAGVRIAVPARSAYGLWLNRNIKHAQLLEAEGFDATIELFITNKLDALAGLRVGLEVDIKKVPGTRIVEGEFTMVQQGACTRKGDAISAQFLFDFLEQAKASGLVAQLIQKHRVHGLHVAPLAGDR
jgi:polar amino acid transport system substrate-binding protein